MANTTLPQARLPISEDGTTFSLPWLRFFQSLSSGTVDPAVIAALEAEIAAAEAAAAAAQITANEALIIAEEALNNEEFGANYGITFAALDETYRPVESNFHPLMMMGIDGQDGDDGIPGPMGPAGAAGNSNRQLWQYRAKTTATSGYPGDGYMLWNNATQISATALIFSHLTQDDLDIDIFLSFLATGQTIVIQDANDSGNSQTWTISSAPTNTNPGTSTSYWTVPVTLSSSSGTGTTGFANNHSLIAVVFSGSGGSGPQGLPGIGIPGQDGIDGGDQYIMIPSNNAGGTGTVTTTGSPASGNLTKFSGSSSITSGDLSGDVTTAGTLATTITANAVTTTKITNAAVTYAKIQNVSANSVLLGAGASGSGAAPVEIALGTGLSMSGTTLQATGAGSIGALVLITETVTSASQASVTFSSIPSTYRDLVVVVRGRGDTASGVARVLIQLNGDTGSNYSWTFMQNTNTGTMAAEYHPSVANMELGYITAATSPSNVPGGTIINILDYKGTTFDKALQAQSNLMTANSSPNLFNVLFSGWWFNTAAVTSVKVFLDAGNFANNSVVSLYGRY